MYYRPDSLVVEPPWSQVQSPARSYQINCAIASLAWRLALEGKNWFLFSHALVAMDTIRKEASRVINISCRTYFTIDLKQISTRLAFEKA